MSSLTPHRCEEELVCCKPDEHVRVPTSVSCHFSCFRAEYFFEFTVSFSRQRSSAHTVRRQTPRAITRIANLFETDYRHCNLSTLEGLRIFLSTSKRKIERKKTKEENKQDSNSQQYESQATPYTTQPLCCRC